VVGSIVMLPLVYEFRSLRKLVSRAVRLVPSSVVPKADSHILRPSKDVALLERIPRKTESANVLDSKIKWPGTNRARTLPFVVQPA
jgi:hypothetical protein